MNETIRMQISAYVDGELPESESELLLRRLSQDPALRAEVAEFTEIGRGMRGEYSVPGIHGLRQRIAAALDADPGAEVETDLPAARKGFIKPLSGLAIAAAVALVAIVGLQQTASVSVEPGAVASGDASEATEYVVPPGAEMREFVRMHGESSSAQGANGMNVRIVSFPTTEDAPADDIEDTESAGTPGADAASIGE